VQRIMSKLKEIFLYREMIASLVRKDLRGRYKGSILGFFWTFLNPLMQLLVYSLVFSIIVRVEVEKYYLFLFVALIPWIFFSSALTSGSSVILAQKDMVKKIYFPREVLPIAHALTNFINMLFSFIVVFIVIIFSGVDINFLALMYLPLIMIIEFTLVLGITFLTSSITVYLRDLEHIMTILNMLWMYLTPILYSITMIPAVYLPYIQLNPMTAVIVAYRDILYYAQVPMMGTLLNAVLMALTVLIVGYLVFTKIQRYFAEEL
jgi:lipopolysaccharide transport system permease protein